jgi:CubicO group peptidase (beta-lactamase class C family)
MIEASVAGHVAPGFEPVRDAFEANFAVEGDVGAACCVHLDGRPVVDLCGGVTSVGGSVTYKGHSLQVVLSTTKGVVATAAHMLAQEGRLDFDVPVAEIWPEFAAEGKGKIPIRWLFSHRAGLAAIDRTLTLQQVYDWQPVIEALAGAHPNWEPGTAHGYHAVTYGWLAGEVIRRAAGMSVGEFVATRIAGPLGLDLWIGLPEAEQRRVADLIPAPRPAPDAPTDPFMARLLDPTSLMHRTFMSPPDLLSAFNDPAFRAAEVPAANGVSSARAISRMYAACIGEVDGVRLLKPKTLDRAMRTESHGEDLVLGYETRFGTGYQLAFPSRPMAGEGSFGHYGMGGSVGFAHPELGLAFAYVMNQMRSSTGVDPRPDALVQATLACLP